MTINIIEVTPKDHAIKLFQQLPQQVYQQDPHYLAPKPAYIKHALNLPQQKILLAMQHNTPLARIVARYVPAAQPDEPLIGQLAYFEAQDAIAAVAPLFECALEWLAAQKVTLVKGPVDTNMWHGQHLSLGPSTQAPFFLEPYNPVYYPELWESCGFSVAEDFYSRQLAEINQLLAKLQPHYHNVVERGFSFRQFRSNSRQQEYKLMYAIAQHIHSSNFISAQPNVAAFEKLLRRLKPFLLEKIIYFICDPTGKEVGFLLAIPDYFQSQQILNHSPRRWFKARLAKRKVNILNIMAIAILPAYQRRGLGSALSYKVYHNAAQHEFSQVNLCMLREGNPADKINGGGVVFRRYRGYQYEL